MGFLPRKVADGRGPCIALLTTDNHRATPQQAQQLCAWTHAVVSRLAPKTVEPDGAAAPVLIFTDSAYEEDVATWGIVLIDMISDTRTTLGDEIPKFFG